MTTSQENTFLSEILSGEVIPQGKLAYFRGRLANRFHAMVLEKFSELEQAGIITRAELARRIGRDAAQITRWLGSAGNWTSDTLSDILLGMGCEPATGIVALGAITAAKESEEEEAQLPNAHRTPPEDKRWLFDLANLQAANDARNVNEQQSAAAL